MVWKIFDDSHEQASDVDIKGWLAQPPPWRQHHEGPIERVVPPLREEAALRGRSYVGSGADEVLRVNVALLLRRPLLVTGRPGLGKTMLAYHLAWKLNLGQPLRWDIGSQTKLTDGLYHYDAVGHLQAASGNNQMPIGQFITLGPLGTALLPTSRPRLLLVDEIDKAGFDLPHDLLHAFEEGSFTIPELVRVGGVAHVFPYDRGNNDDLVPVQDGRISTLHHPVVVITSNGEREFPEPFLRRCVQLDLQRPQDGTMRDILRSQLGREVNPEHLDSVVKEYGKDATDVLVQALFLKDRFSLDDQGLSGVLKREKD